MRIFLRVVSLFLCVLLALSFCACGKNQGNTDTSTGTDAQDVPAGLVINEYCSKNEAVLYDSDGDYNDWLELYNPTDKTVSLSGYTLSDDPADTSKWAFPETSSVEAGGYLLIYLSGKNIIKENGEIHASFKVGGDDKSLILSYKSRAADTVAVMELDENTSYGRGPDDPTKFYYYAKPTPGKMNTTTGFETLALVPPYEQRKVTISEVSAAYATGNREDTFYDWIELFNHTDKPVSLKGYGLCKSLSGVVHKFTDLTIDAHGYAIVNAAGKKGAAAELDDEYAPFTVNSAGEEIYLLNPDGSTHDVFSTGKLRIGLTSGRTSGEARVYYTKPTPGRANAKTFYTGYNTPPVFEKGGGYAASDDILTVSCAAGGTVRFTTDGSEPTVKSQVYTEPLQLNGSLTLRAAVFSDTLLPSDSVSETYIIGQTHTIPVVCISSDPDGLFSYRNGIMAKGPGYEGDVFPYTRANFWKNWEREATIEYYVDGKKELEFNAGICLFGQYTKAYDQKSLALHLRDSYGEDEITYPFFEGNAITTVNDLVLRAGGQDQNKAKLRDAFGREVLEEYSKAATMDWQPVAVYINGKYWGYYDLREKINESYLESHQGINPDAVDIVKGDSIELAGSKERYWDLFDYMKSHDITKPAIYNYVASQMDIDCYIDYLIAEIFFCNTDTGNIKFYRGYEKSDKFEWVIYDLDVSLSTASINGGYNSMWGMFNPQGHGSAYMFSTFVQRNLIQNPTFKKKFIERYVYLLNNAFTTERMLNILDGMREKIEPEVRLADKRWDNSDYANWKSEAALLREVVSKRRAKAIYEFDKFFKFSDAQMKTYFPNGTE